LRHRRFESFQLAGRFINSAKADIPARHEPALAVFCHILRRRVMAKPIEDIHQFIRSLDPRQRQFFVARETEHQKVLQESLLALGRGLSVVSELNGESLAIMLNEPNSNRPTAGKRK